MTSSPLSKDDTKPFKAIVDEWCGVLGIPQVSLGLAAGKSSEVFNKAIKVAPGTLPSTKLVQNIAKAISLITKEADGGNNPSFSLDVIGKEPLETVIIDTFYTGKAISLSDAMKSLKGEEEIADLVEGTSSPKSDAFWDTILPNPQRVWKPDRSPPSSLLTTMYGIVPFHGREYEMEDLTSWAEKEAVFGVRLYTGVGGMGKTRLAMEACSQLGEHGFTCGFLDYDYADMLIEYLRRDYQSEGDKKLLLILDYAETNYQVVASLLKISASLSCGHLRILLLSRAAGDWWEAVQRSHSIVRELIMEQCSTPIELGALALTVEERCESYLQAAKSFADKLGRPSPRATQQDFTESYYERVLLIHMMALINLDEQEALDNDVSSHQSEAEDKESVQDIDKILDGILFREHKFWCEQLFVLQLSPTLYNGFHLLMGIISGRGGVENRESAINLIKEVKYFQGQTQATIEAIAELLHSNYSGKMWIEPIAPDLLQERLVSVAMKKDMDAFLPFFL